MTGHSAASLRDPSNLSTSNRAADMTASSDQLPANSINDTDGGRGDREDGRAYDADDDR